MYNHVESLFPMLSELSRSEASYYLGAGILLLFLLIQFQPSRNTAPVVNAKKWYELTWSRAKTEFAFNSKEILAAAGAASNGKPFQIATTHGFMTVLDPQHIAEIRNDDRLSFPEHIHRAFNGSIPGFDGFDQRGNKGQFSAEIAQKHLTAYLNQMTAPLSEECTRALDMYLTNNPDWHTISANHAISRIISKMSSRIFLGEEFCRDESWVETSGNYASKLFAAQERLSLWPEYLRPFVHWFMPDCKQLRQNVATCRSIIEPKLAARKAQKAAQQKQGVDPDRVEDTLEWMQKVAKGRTYDPTKVQLSLSLGAIHTTTDLTTWLLLCIAQQPEVVDRMRAEIISVLKADGWKKIALYNLKLMDSVMKESQRLKPNVLGKTSLSTQAKVYHGVENMSLTIAAPMRRRVMKDITLSDGSFLPRGTMTVVLSKQMRDPELYPNPDEFQADRFLKMRQIPGKENQAQFVTTSPQHMGFSHGQHSCPGRFFAANETKILLCHLLLKYDFRISDNSPTDSVAFGLALIPNPTAKLDFRRRKEELDLSSI